MEEEKGHEKEGCCSKESSCCAPKGCCCGKELNKYIIGGLAGLLLAAGAFGVYKAGKCAAKPGCCVVSNQAQMMTTEKK